MPLIGSSAQGGVNIGATNTTYVEVVTVADGVIALTKPLSMNGMSRITLNVTLTAGAPAGCQFLLATRPHGNTPTVDFPSIPIGTLNMPVVVTIHVACRAALVAVQGAPAGGPHTFQIVMVATGTS